MNKDQQNKVNQALAMAAAMQKGGPNANPMAAMASMNAGRSAGDTLASALAGDQMAWSQFSMNPNLYASDPEGVHRYLPQLVAGAGGPQGANLIFTIARSNPTALVPHTSALIDRCSDPMMGSIYIQALKEVALADSNNIFQFIPRIMPFSKAATGGYIVSQMIGSAAKANSPRDAAAQMFLQFIAMLNSKPDGTTISGVLMEISNIKDMVPAPLLSEHLPLIRTFKAQNAVIVTTLEDYILGRTNENLSIRIDDLEVRIANLNEGCSKCLNFDQIVAYIDANIRDVKDFIGDVTKKLPTPKRLEVVGTLRKTFILHFECVHTGREYAIQSADWNKWLKMGFSLLKAGKMAFDIGTGNPLGLVSTGIDCVKEIYNAYKTQDDDEFLTYIKNPFLLSSEQDLLLNKLREQGFFEKFAYDNQMGGWYLLNPDDGVLPNGATGSVTKVRAKEISGPKSEDIVTNPMNTTSSTSSTTTITESASSSPTVGPRAAAVRAQMAASGVITSGNSGSDETLMLAEQLVAINQKLEVMQQKIARLETDNRELRTLVNSHSNAGCACVIS